MLEHFKSGLIYLFHNNEKTSDEANIFLGYVENLDELKTIMKQLRVK